MGRSVNSLPDSSHGILDLVDGKEVVRVPPYANLGTLSLAVIAVCAVIMVIWGIDLSS